MKWADHRQYEFTGLPLAESMGLLEMLAGSSMKASRVFPLTKVESQFLIVELGHKVRLQGTILLEKAQFSQKPVNLSIDFKPSQIKSDLLHPHLFSQKPSLLVISTHRNKEEALS